MLGAATGAAHAWQRLGGYLTRHEERERRSRRERLEWLGDAVLRDLVVRHVFAYCVCAGDGEPPAPAAQCAGLCDRCCSNETLARVWDHARAAHVAVCSSSKRRRKRLGRRERHASKWKADMVESALGALITDEKLSRAFSLDMIDVLLSSVLRAAAWAGREKTSSADYDASASPAKQTLRQCKLQHLGWTADFSGDRNTNLFRSLDSEEERDSDDVDDNLNHEIEDGMKGGGNDSIECGAAHPIDSVGGDTAAPSSVKTGVSKSSADILGTAALHATLSFVIYTQLGESATPNLLTRVRQRIISQRERLWDSAMRNLKKQTLIRFDRSGERPHLSGAYMGAAAAAHDEWSLRNDRAREREEPAGRAAPVSGSGGEMAVTAAAAAGAVGARSHPSLMKICRYMVSTSADYFISEGAALTTAFAPDVHDSMKAPCWRTPHGYSRSRKAAELALQFLGNASASRAIKRSANESDDANHSGDEPFQPALKRPRTLSKRGESTATGRQVVGSAVTSRSSISATSRDLALLSRFSDHDELLGRIETAIHWDPGLSGTSVEK